MTSDGDESGDVRLIPQPDAPADHPEWFSDEEPPRESPLVIDDDGETVFDRIRRESLDIETS